jgi:hypothetical protein
MSSRLCLRTIAMPDGSSPGASGQRSATASFAVSSATTSLLSSILTNTRPFKSVVANSGLPPSGIVAATAYELASSTVALPERPLKTKTFFEKGS